MLRIVVEDQDRPGLERDLDVRADGRKELVAVSDGYRESEESWAEVLRDLKRRGMRAPVLAVGDGALGFWAALREVFPETREQRCWVHKIARVLDALPKSLQPKAKPALHEIMNAENKEAAETAVDRFQETYGAKYPKATEKLLKDREALLAHFAYPAEHWLHLRTTNAIESTFATVRLRTKKTKGAGSRSAGLTPTGGCASPPRVAQFLGRPALPWLSVLLAALLGADRVSVRTLARLGDWYPRRKPFAVEARRFVDAMAAAA